MSVTSSDTLDIGQLYQAHQPWLQGWLKRQLGCRSLAADLSHDTFVQVLAGNAVDDIREPRAWLLVIARRVLFNFWRRRDLEQAYLEVLASLPEPLAPSEEERALVFEALAQLDQALAEVSQRARQVFLLSQLEQLTYAQIAEQLQISPMTVRRDMHAAISACCQLQP